MFTSWVSQWHVAGWLLPPVVWDDLLHAEVTRHVTALPPVHLAARLAQYYLVVFILGPIAYPLRLV